MEYRRLFILGGTYFFTLVTYNRRPIFTTPESIEKLRTAFRYTLDRHPFTIIASVILPDHLHMIWTLPPESCDFSTRWRLIKSHFTHHWGKPGIKSESESRQHKGEADVWQRRFWEHQIRNEDDLSRHVDYIHYNPVRHGLVQVPADWKYSSFARFVRDGFYALDWGGGENKMAGESGIE